MGQQGPLPNLTEGRCSRTQIERELPRARCRGAGAEARACVASAAQSECRMCVWRAESVERAAGTVTEGEGGAWNGRLDVHGDSNAAEQANPVSPNQQRSVAHRHQ